MDILYLGSNNTFFSDAFLDAGGYNVTISSSSSTEIVLVQVTTGQVTTITGTGLVYDGSGVLVEAGTITGIAFQDIGLTTLATFSAMNWSMADLHAALIAEATGDSTALNALFAGQLNVLDLSAAGAATSTSGMDAYLLDNVTTVTGSIFYNDISLFGSTRDVTVNGGDADNDVITGSGNDTLNGGSGSDSMQSAGGTDELNGGGGNDTLNGGGDDDTLNGDDGDDVLQGGLGNDILNGGADDDLLQGGGGGASGIDVLTGGTGDDTFSASWADYTGDTITDLEAGETVRMTTMGQGNLSASWSAVTELSISTSVVSGVDLSVGVDVDNDGSTDVTFILGGYAGVAGSIATVMLPTYLSSNLRYSDARLGLELFFVPTAGIMPTASGADDKMFGTSGANTLSGLGGADIMNGMAGDDTLNGGDGNDRIVGGQGHDTLNGGGNNDYLFGSEGKDTLNGDDGDDGLYGGEGKDVLNGGLGNDRLDGNENNDTLRGDAGNDVLYGGLGSDRLFGGDDGDTMYAGTDTLGQDTSSNWLYGEGGNDDLFGDDGIDAYPAATIMIPSMAMVEMTNFTAIAVTTI